jgi:16S rRNA (cytosine1402-N4)-methyltransferase
VPERYHHRPVLLDETLSLLELGPGDTVIDGTVGGAGHAVAILERTAPDGRLLGLDVDDEALEEAGRILRPYGERARLVRSSYRRLNDVIEELGMGRVDAILLDLGVSSRHLDAPERGFRFAADTADATPLDMRMDRRLETTAADLLARASAAELQEIFSRFGELPGSRTLARAIVEARRAAPLRTAADLRAVIDAARIGRGRKHHPATLVFQALRIAVNDELGALADGIEQAIEALVPGGRLAVLAYHSLEDRRVKNAFRDAARGCVCPPRQPVCTCGKLPRLEIVTRRPVTAGEAETRANPRARSARLRVARRLAEVA